jgi:hypothetical protein
LILLPCSYGEAFRCGFGGRGRYNHALPGISENN